MPISPLSQLPPPPLPTDPEDVFDAHAGVSLTAQVTFTNEMNDKVIPGINAAVTTIDGYRQAAATSAQNAADSATAAAQKVQLAADQVGLANTARTDAQAARDSALAAAAAAGSAAGLPSLTGNAGKFLGVNAAANAVAWIDAGQKVGDVLTTARAPDASYLSMNGGIYLQSAYPALFALIGLIGGDVGINWSSVATGYTSIIKVAEGANGTLVGITSLSNMVVRSTDNGVTWTAVNAGVATNATDIDTDGNGKWVISLSSALGGSCIRVSVNDGVTWSAGPSGIQNVPVFVRYVGNNIWLAGGGNSLLRSSDNGVTWGVPPTNPSVNTGSVMFTDRNGLVILYSSTGGGFRSVDGFATAATTVSLGLTPIGGSADGNGTWLLVGTSGTMARSLDNGQTFQTVASGSTANLFSASNNGKGTWLVGGANGTLRRSKDNLNTWDAISGLSNTILTVMMLDSLALAGSNGGQIYRSVPFYAYDTATQFRVPQQLNTPQGLNSYIKAKVAA